MSPLIVICAVLWLACGGLGAFVCHHGLRREMKLRQLDHVDAGWVIALLWHGFLLFMILMGLASLIAAFISEREMIAEWSEGDK